MKDEAAMDKQKAGGFWEKFGRCKAPGCMLRSDKWVWTGGQKPERVSCAMLRSSHLVLLARDDVAHLLPLPPPHTSDITIHSTSLHFRQPTLQAATADHLELAPEIEPFAIPSPGDGRLQAFNRWLERLALCITTLKPDSSESRSGTDGRHSDQWEGHYRSPVHV